LSQDLTFRPAIKTKKPRGVAARDSPREDEDFVVEDRTAIWKERRDEKLEQTRQQLNAGQAACTFQPTLDRTSQKLQKDRKPLLERVGAESGYTEERQKRVLGEHAKRAQLERQMHKTASEAAQRDPYCPGPPGADKRP
jgi:hypothetical protein